MLRTTAAALAALASMAFAAAPAQADSPVTEDDPRWDCRVMGDDICGPGNSNGVEPGLYVAGHLASPWPRATICARPVTITDLMLPSDNCRTEFVAPALVRVTGWPQR